MASAKISMTTPMSEVDRKLKEMADIVDARVIRALKRLGEETVAYAKSRGEDESWIDRSGNLRSSIGYVIVVNGEVKTIAGFKEVLNGSEGVKVGKELALELAKRFTNGYALIVVAGMRYAELVEAIDSKDVLASPELFARRKFSEMKIKLDAQIERIVA